MGYRIEELLFRRKCGYTYHTEFYRGRPIKKADMIEIFETKVGDFTESEWLELAKASILEYGQTRLYKAVRKRVNTLPWLKTDAEKDIYTLECISLKAYEAWEDFSYQEESIKEEAMKTMKINNVNFNLGQVVMTCGIAQRMEYDTFFGIEVMTSLVSQVLWLLFANFLTRLFQDRSTYLLLIIRLFFHHLFLVLNLRLLIHF